MCTSKVADTEKVSAVAESPVSASASAVPHRTVGPRTDGKFLLVEGKRFRVKGVTYGTFLPNDDGEPYPPPAGVRDDFQRMRDAGINTVRLYSPPSDRIADAAAEAGLYLIPDICWGPRRCENFDDPQRLKGMYDWTREHSRRLAGHPSLLMFSIGNEIPPLIVRWYGGRRIESFLRTLGEIVKEQAPDSLITYANHPPAEHLNLSFLDVVSFNVYLERETDFRRYLARLQNLAGDRPLLLSELGLDSREHGDEEQARSLEWQLRAVFEGGLCGATVYAWTDQWGICDEAIEGWSFGLTDANRAAKPALQAVREAYTIGDLPGRGTPWPLVSVVVASYNGGATLDACLSALDNLRYPAYEVIVIDDGSTDNTPAVLERHRVRSIRVPNGGLSRARNLGIEAAEGEIVAFTDSDACPDPDWLYFLVTTLEAQDAAAVGGPNLSPPGDGFVAQCVDFAPGNPTHVLLDDVRADHVPGCNMAFRKSALKEIGGFDHTHRAAGDDVDVCWKLLVREKTIAFSPAALVWHHRRGTVRGFLRQQKGYGYAEAHLQRRYPGHFNVFGHLVWQGAIYDEMHSVLRRDGLPALFHPRIYQGLFGGAGFQALYQPFALWRFQIFTTAEWQVVAACFFAAGLLSPGRTALESVLLTVAALMGAMTVLSAASVGRAAVTARQWKGANGVSGFLLVSGFQIAQPLARAYGRLIGAGRARCLPSNYPAVRRFWGDLGLRHAWLERVEKHLGECGWVCRPSSPWSRADLDILGPGPYRMQICSVYEENLVHGEHYVRYRITARAKPYAPILFVELLLLLYFSFVWPSLLPLAVPVGSVLWCLIRAKSTMITAVSQLASECAEALGMPPVEEDPGTT